MPGKRSPEKLIAKRRAFEQQPPATKDAWLAAAANDKRVKEERKRNKEMGEDLNSLRRAQYWTGVQQQAESERLEQWNITLHQWDAKVNEDARHESIARQQALAGRMVAIANDLQSTFQAFIEEGQKPNEEMTQARVNRIMEISTGIKAQVDNMRYGRDDHGWQPAATDGLTGRVEYSHPPGVQGARHYVHQSTPSRPTYSRMPVSEERDPTAYDPTARVWPSHSRM